MERSGSYALVEWMIAGLVILCFSSGENMQEDADQMINPVYGNCVIILCQY
jgi:hypothetical protein